MRSDLDIKTIQLKNSQEDANSYKGQVESLQAYIKGINVIKEQFDSSRVAGNQIKIMQDLQQENIKMRTSVEGFQA